MGFLISVAIPSSRSVLLTKSTIPFLLRRSPPPSPASISPIPDTRVDCSPNRRFRSSSHVPSTTAVPATRSQNLKSQHALPLSSLPHEVKEEDEEALMERRLDLETQDYGGTGANKDHDPKSPGKA